MNTEQRILCLAARTSIDPIAEQQLLELLHQPIDWSALWAQAHLHEVQPLLTASLRRLAARAPIPAAWLEQAQRHFYANLLRNTALAEELLRVLTAFTQAGISVLPVKGLVLAETLYGNLALRPLADLDVLVQPEQLPAARAILATLGYQQEAEPGYENAHHPFHDPPYYYRTPQGALCLELHWGLWASHFFRLKPNALWQRSVTARIAGTDIAILSPEDTLLHLAIHRSRSALRLRFVCDIAELLRKHATLDWEYILSQANAAGARTALFTALALAEQLLGTPLPSTILARLRISRLKQQLLEQTCGTSALFRPAASPKDLSQQPHLIVRIFEQDGIGHIMQALGASLSRTAKKQLHHARMGMPRHNRVAE